MDDALLTTVDNEPCIVKHGQYIVRGTEDGLYLATPSPDADGKISYERISLEMLENNCTIRFLVRDFLNAEAPGSFSVIHPVD